MKRKLHLFVNKQCNLNCRYCYWPEHPHEEMSEETSDGIIAYLQNHPDRYDYIVFFGGEPMLSPHILAKFINNLGQNMNFIVMTNGTIHPENLLSLIDPSVHRNICFTFSFDGLYQMDRSIEAAKKIKSHIGYLRATKRARATIGCIFSPYHYKMIPENMIRTLQYTDTVIFFRICDLPNQWPMEALKEHIHDFGKIVDIATYYTVCKNKLVHLPNHIEQTQKTNDAYGLKGNTCQKSLVYTDICGIDGKKYLCEPSYANQEENYGYLWEERDSYAVEWDSYPENHDCPYHYCLYHNSRNTKFEQAMEKMRDKFAARRRKLVRLKEAKEKYLLKIDKKGRLLRLAQNYFRH